MQPASFTDPPMRPDGERLPIYCNHCGRELPEDGWDYDEDEEITEVNGRDRWVKVIIWYIECPGCETRIVQVR